MGGQGLGIFTAPSIIEQDVERQYGVRSIGRTDEIKEGYYAIMREGQQHKPIIQHILNTAQTLFKGLGTSVVIAGNP
jgi:LysR family transcriptional activator of nhaA